MLVIPVVTITAETLLSYLPSRLTVHINMLVKMRRWVVSRVVTSHKSNNASSSASCASTEVPVTAATVTFPVNKFPLNTFPLNTKPIIPVLFPGI